jgi:pimeloyl-ACP methyl ester carboxylesterase
MFTPTSADISAHGTRLHYYRIGGDKPPLILAHGLTDDGLCWTPVAEMLADAYDVIMVDTRGHGKSEAPETGYTLLNITTELAHVIRGLSLEKPVILGHSMGAITALMLAALFPDMPRSILLEDPPPFWNFQSITPEQMESRNAFIEWIGGLKRKTRDELLTEGRNTNPTWSEAELGPWVDSKHRCSTRVADLALPEDVPSLDFETLFKAITCHTLLISASVERGALSSKEDITMLKELLPHLKVEYVVDAGHNIRREQFSQYIKIVLGALAEISNRSKA